MYMRSSNTKVFIFRIIQLPVFWKIHHIHVPLQTKHWDFSESNICSIHGFVDKEDNKQTLFKKFNIVTDFLNSTDFLNCYINVSSYLRHLLFSNSIGLMLVWITSCLYKRHIESQVSWHLSLYINFDKITPQQLNQFLWIHGNIPVNLLSENFKKAADFSRN